MGEGRTIEAGRLLTLREVAEATGLHPELIERFINLALIEAFSVDPELGFEHSVVLRVNKIVRLRRDLGVNYSGIGLVLDLLDRIDALEREIARLELEGRLEPVSGEPAPAPGVQGRALPCEKED